MIRDAGGECFAGRCDIADGASPSRPSAAQVARALRPLRRAARVRRDLPGREPRRDHWELWRRVMSTNVDSLFHLASAFVPGMVERGWGRVIAISSTVFHTGTPRFAAYTTSKGAVIGFVRALATEVGDAGVTVNSIAPSLTRTAGTLAGPQDRARLVRVHARAAGDQAHPGAGGSRRRGLVLRLRRLRLHHRPDAAGRRRAHARLTSRRFVRPPRSGAFRSRTPEVFAPSPARSTASSRRIPDGETGPRSRWNSWTAPTYAGAPAGSSSYRRRRAATRRGSRRARRSTPPIWCSSGSASPTPRSPPTRASSRAGAAGAIARAHALPGLPALADRADDGADRGGLAAAVEPAHLRQLHAEIDEILGAIPHERLAIQWDVCQDVGIWEGYYPAYFDDPKQG